MESTTIKNETLNTLKESSMFREIWRRFKKNKLALGALVVFIVLIAMLVLAPVYMDEGLINKQSLVNRLQPSSSEFPLGTDGFGRDELTRLVYGGRTTVLIGVTSALGALLVGGVLGIMAGYYGGTLDAVLMRAIDILAAMPTILLAIAIVSAMGPSMKNLILAISISRIPAFARVIRAAVLGTVGVEYIEAAQAGGTSDFRIMYKHILPNILGTVIVQTTITIAYNMLSAAGLSFVGLGVQPPTPEWGFMLSEAKEFMRVAPGLMFYPGLSIMVTVLLLSLIGDGLRDAFDPRLKN